MSPALRQLNLFEDHGRSRDRETVLARYRQLREIGKRLNHEILNFISRDAMLKQARRLGLAQGRTLILDDPEEMNYVFDLIIYASPGGRTRAIDRFARSARFEPGSDEAFMLEAMRAARFSILMIDRRHETIGLVATDLANGAPLWLVDLGLESTLPDGALIASRLYSVDEFCMTAGVIAPFDFDMVELMPRRLTDSSFRSVIGDWRFAEALYRIVLHDPTIRQFTYQDLPGDGDSLAEDDLNRF